jgi:hypothetical protein
MEDEVTEVTTVVYGEYYEEDDYEIEWEDWLNERIGNAV